MLLNRYNRRLPFELNTARRCAVIVFYQTVYVVCGTMLFIIVPSLLVCFIIYSKAFLMDIKSLFVRMDRLSKDRSACSPAAPSQHSRKTTTAPPSGNSVLKIHEGFRDVVDLHRRLNRYDMRALSVIKAFVIFKRNIII